MFNFGKLLKKTALIAVAVAGFSTVAAAQILIVDDERVEREAAAYKDFNLQTGEYREQIVQLRQFISRGGQLEQQLGELEKQKSIIGNDKYEEEKRKLQTQAVAAQRNLAALEYFFDERRQEAMRQVERARQPVIRAILSEKKAQVIMLKRLVLGSAAGLDVTTEFIEKLDAELPAVSLTMPEKATPATAEENQ
ncbi:hypothetical protein GCM10017044_24620 [Kordiimonas sediminis]|uniref:OmpH family outer membrane protein n=1 Tax=Kordiimonas sediminis TaxID=1735581 RepID=A0A919E9W9_9PROT|nr:hypothetical protein [Kordiimonas sediminis]GHF28472.1 hypothetical protein GCM10017044_24620 [Kordiimonas sediminis]